MKGDCVLITRGPREGKEWGEYLRAKSNARVYFLKTIKLLPIPLNVVQQKLFAHLEDFDCIIFTSSVGPIFFFGLLKEYKIKVSWGPHMPRMIMLAGRRGSVVAIHGKVLLLRTTIATDDLPRFLKTRGVQVTEVPIYKTEYLHEKDPRVEKLILGSKLSHIFFASPSAVAGFSKRMHGASLTVARDIPAVAIGPKVGQALAKAKFNHIRVARTPSIEGMVAVMHRF